MPESGTPSPENGNLIATVLKTVFGPIVKESSRWPPLLAYGLPGIVAVLLIVVLRTAVPNNLVLLVAVAIALPLAGYIVTDIRTRRSAGAGGEPRLEASIVQPSRGGTVGRKIQCWGTASGLPHDHHLWLAVESNGLVWPKEGEVQVTRATSRWEATVYEDGATRTFARSLYLADPQGHQAILDWLDDGRQKGEYAELKGLRGTRRLDRVDRLRLSRRA